MHKVIYVGLDVHKETIMISALRESDTFPFTTIQKRNNNAVLKKYFLKLKEQGELYCCYEAGFSGFTMYRFLKELGIKCDVIAPGLIPTKAGDHIKTDRRDAQNLAINLKAGSLTAIHVSTPGDEAVRDYIRMRDNFKTDSKKKKQQILSFLHHLGVSYSEGGNWTQKHLKWLKNLSFDESLQKEVLDEYLIALNELEEKIRRLDCKIEDIASQKEYKPLVDKFICMKGISILTALSLRVEIGDFKRFQTAGKFMKFIGLVPKENSSGQKRIQGGITKAGNARLRKLLVESSWHYQYYQPSKRLTLRRKGADLETVAYADRAGRRLTRKYNRLLFNGKLKKKAVTAVARELCGFICGMATDRYA